MTGQLIEKIEGLKNRIAEIDLKVRINQKPIEPNEPRPPFQSGISKSKKPSFFQPMEIIIIFILLAFISLYINLFMEEPISIVLLISFGLTLMIRLYYYLNELDRHSSAIKAYKNAYLNYEDKLETFNNQKSKYEKDLMHYQLGDANLRKERTNLQNELKGVYSYMAENISKLSEQEKEFYYNHTEKKTDSEEYIRRTSMGRNRVQRLNLKSDSMEKDKLRKGIDFISKLTAKQRDFILNLLKKVQDVQNSKLNDKQKAAEIKRILWSDRSSGQKLIIGGLLGTIFGIIVFGTGGIGIAGLGSAIGIWGFLVGTAGGVLISSLIQNFEKQNKK